MLVNYLLVLLAIVMLYFGADWLVKGSSSLAARLGISPLVIGLTVVAFGTSMPEMVVSVNAAIENHSGITIGNVIGSNIFNICIILGFAAVFNPLIVRLQLIKIDMPVMILATLLFWVFFLNNQISRFEAVVFFMLFLIYTFFTVYYSKREKVKLTLIDIENEYKAKYKSWTIEVLLIGLGFLVLIFGSNFLVKGSIEIAKFFNINETIIGLTIIAAGTSMPELATSIVAAVKKESDISIGNIIGSNIFNLLAILGVSGMIKPLIADKINLIDLGIMVITALLLFPIMKSSMKIKRWEGVLLLVIYASYLYYLWPK